MLAGTGGSETFTAGHVRELLRRGIDTQIVMVGTKTAEKGIYTILEMMHQYEMRRF